jgi:hypothetical protein
MTDPGQFYLFVATKIPDGAASKVKAAQLDYLHKRLDSTQANWQRIADELKEPALPAPCSS